VIYQIYPRSFQDSNNDGIGDLQGILNRLDYLGVPAGGPNDLQSASLGVDAIWISPIYPSPMVDFGYDVSDYCNIDPLFGDLQTFDRLVSEAHRRGIKVIIDWVPNHTSDQHPWFQESRRDRDNPKRDWYLWRDPKPDGSPPNNWGSFFGGPAWTLDAQTGQYYLHQFVKEQPDLNWRNPQVVEAMLETLRFWLRRGVDGFRMDVIGLIIKDADLRDNPLNLSAPANLPPNDLFNRQHHIYNENQEDVHPVLRQIRQVLDEFSSSGEERCAIGELWGDIKSWVRYYGELGDELHLPFNFRLIWTPWEAQAIRHSVDSLEAALPPFAWPNYVLGNHDQPRLASRIRSQENARLAAMLLLTLRGTPTLYYGEELGMENGVIPSERIVDPQGKNLGAERTRDIARTPMQWDAGPNAGFTSGEPWLPICSDYQQRNVARQAGDPHSILTLYRRLLNLRHASPALFGGNYQWLEAPTNCYLYLRTAGSDQKLVALNFSAERSLIFIQNQTSKTGNILLSTHLDRQGPFALATDLELRPFEGVLIDLTMKDKA
jgi:alpha-glucosidase